MTKPTLCLESASSEPRPMDDVLAERRSSARRRPAAERDLARRIRAGIVASTQACECSWPVRLAETVSGHEEDCTAHLWFVRRQEQGLRDATVTVHFDACEMGSR